MSKFRIYEFHPQIYPRRVWVAVGGTFEDVKERFTAMNGQELEESEDCLATTYMVQAKRDEHYLGHLVWFPYKNSMTTKNITHESFHLASDMFALLGCKQHYDNQEPFAYLVGWVADCIDKVKRNKVEFNKV